MSADTSLALVTAFAGLLTAGALALVNSWITARAGIDENLRAQRLKVYPALWQLTAGVSRWPRADLTWADLAQLHEAYRTWYYATGGMFLSETARARYGEVQELVAALLAARQDSDTGRLVDDVSYADLRDTTSSLRTALTEDLDTRRRRSAWENRRRSRRHAESALDARARIQRVTGTAPPRRRS